MEWSGVDGTTDLQEIGDEVAAQVGLSAGADVVALEQIGEAVETAAGDRPPAETLSSKGKSVKKVSPINDLAFADCFVSSDGTLVFLR